jgi:hypothetical protein
VRGPPPPVVPRSDRIHDAGANPQYQQSSLAKTAAVETLNTRGGVMNTHDPADSILYVHMTQEMDPYSTPVEGGRTYCRLPAEYANKSSRTCLRHRLKSCSAGLPPS